jgi:hypothetical protein
MFPTTGRAEIKVRAPKPVNIPSENKEKEPVEADLRSDTATSPTKSICPKRCNVWDFRFQQNGDWWDFISQHREEKELCGERYNNDLFLQGLTKKWKKKKEDEARYDRWYEEKCKREEELWKERERLEKEGKWKELAILDGYDLRMFDEMADDLEWESQQRHRIAGGWTTAREQGINYGKLHSSKSLLDEYHYWSW